MQTSPETPESLCDSNRHNHHAQRREQQQHHQPAQQPYISPYPPVNAALTSRKWPPEPARPEAAARHPAERQQQRQQQGQSAAHEAYRATEAAYLNTNNTFIDKATRARLIELARDAGARVDDIVLPPGGVDEEKMIAAAQLVMLSKRAWEEGW